MIEGLTAITGPLRGSLTPHKFSVPADFPVNKYASKWVEDGNDVIEASNPQIISQANVQAAGWQVWQVIDKSATDNQRKLILEQFQAEQLGLPVEKRDKKVKPEYPPAIRTPFIRVVGRRKYVLMFRPAALQAAITKIYADTSRALVSQEVRGESARANENNDPGIITSADLRQFRNFEQEPDEGETYLPANQGEPSQLSKAADLNVQ